MNTITKTGLNIMKIGAKVASGSAGLNLLKTTYEEMRVFLEDITQGQSINYISLTDNYYYIPTYDEAIDVLENVVQFFNIPYVKDTFDCDNFSYLVSATMGWVFKTNCCGVVHGAVNIGHFWNSIVCYKDSKLALIHYDAMRGLWKEQEKGQPIRINGWTYKPDSYRYF